MQERSLEGKKAALGLCPGDKTFQTVLAATSPQESYVFPQALHAGCYLQFGD